jgi:hypothetical protein
MDYSQNSIHFLWAAYILVFVAQIAFVAWLAKRWAETGREDR